MKTKLVLFFMLCFIYCYGQPVVFNKLYNDNQNFNQDAVSILPLSEKGYLLAGGAADNGNVVKSSLIKLNNQGDTIWLRMFDFTPYGERINRVIYSLDSNYLAVGSVRDTNSHSGGLVMKTDTSGNLIWWNTYGGIYNDVLQDVKKTSDGGYIIAGWTSSFTPQPNPNLYDDGYVVKIDSLGNIQWENHYGDTTENHFYSVDLTSDGGYILGGRTFQMGTNGNLWMVKINSVGNLQWEQNYGGPNIDFGKTVIQTLDGGYIISGSYQLVFLGDKNAYVVKTDSVGNLQWDNQFEFSAYSTISELKQTKDSSYFVCGSVTINEVEGFLLKMDKNGDSLWSKNYRYYPTIGNNIEHYFYGMELLDSGYIAMCGMTINLNSTDNNNAWLVVIDSTGCADSSCLPTGLKDFVDINGQYYSKLSPNPNNGNFIINYSLPQNTTCLLQIFDVMGKQVYKQVLQQWSIMQRLSLTTLSAGMYVAKVTSGEWSSVVKFVRE